MRLTIITINFNNSAGLEKTIQSVVSQTHKKLEYIIIDSGSTDNSLAVLHAYSHSITHWISEPDSGIYDAMNKGISIARGTYLQFLNANFSKFTPSMAFFTSFSFTNSALKKNPAYL